MTQAHRIAAQIAAAHHIDPAQAQGLVDFVLDAIARAVLSGDQITLPGIGRFQNVTVAEHQDPHPWKGDPITVPASTHLVFEPLTGPAEPSAA